MKQPTLFLSAILLGNFFLHNTFAAELTIPQDKNIKTSLSIYNTNLGFVKDTRKTNLEAGKSTIGFEGVSSNIQAETAMLLGDGITVLEQNYDYNLLTPINILQASVGQKVQVATLNLQTGEETFQDAEIVTSNYGTPVLKFSYGYETNINGRIIYNKLPDNLRTKPTLIISLDNATSGEKELELAYLTKGLKWKADYIAELFNSQELSLNGLVTLTNESGTNYQNAHIQLIAGDVNHQEDSSPQIMRAALADNIAMLNNAPMAQRENFSDYHIYTLPNTTTINDKQVKQVNLMSNPSVQYQKKYSFTSPLSISPYRDTGYFEDKNPTILFTITNNKSSGLGEPLPAGIVRLYQKDSLGNLQFIGSDNIKHTSVDSKIELKTGSAFDIVINGKTTDSQKLNKNTRQQTIEVSFKNNTDNSVSLEYIQDINYDHTLIEESQTSNLKNANQRIWNISINPHSETTLTYSLRVTNQQ